MEEASGLWWIYLVAGAFWLLLSVIVFRFDYTSVSAISILFGLVMLGSAVNEFLAVVGASTGWKIAHIAFGLACVVIGIVAFVHPGNTFAALAAVMSFYFILKGMFDVVLGIVIPELRWLRIAVGLAILSAIENFFFIPYYPWWSVLIIALDVWVLWALTRPGAIRT